jgi:hypothetical protein
MEEITRTSVGLSRHDNGFFAVNWMTGGIKRRLLTRVSGESRALLGLPF